jgi:hypothetical protein
VVFSAGDGAPVDVANAMAADVATGRATDADPMADATADAMSDDATPDAGVEAGMEASTEAGIDAAMDAPTDTGAAQDSPSILVEDASDGVPAPRQVFPQSVSRVTGRNPDFRWILPAMTDGAQLVVCRDRACTVELNRVTVRGDHYRAAAELPASTTVYWKVRGLRGPLLGTTWSPTWEFMTPTVSAPICAHNGLIADFNGDGLSDFASGGPSNTFSVYVFYGQPAIVGAIRPDRIITRVTGDFASAVSHAGDINGDGYSDLVISAPREPMLPGDLRGTVYVHYGSMTGLSALAARVVFGFSNGGGFGAALAGAGDLNGDGYADIVVGAPYESMIGPERGAAFVYYGDPMTVLSMAQVFSGANNGDNFGAEVGGAGDVNGDGFADLIIGAEHGVATNVYYGGVGQVSGVVSRAIGGVQRSGSFAATVAHIGDINGDGYSDVGLGSPGSFMGAGGLSVYTGSAAGISRNANAGIVGVDANGALGSSLSTAGDVDNDGIDDLIVGSPGANNARVYLGTGNNNLRFHRLLTGADATVRFGISAGWTPNLHGQRRIVLLVGAPFETRMNVDPVGAISLYYTIGNAVPAMRDDVISVDQSNGRFGGVIAY